MLVVSIADPATAGHVSAAELATSWGEVAAHDRARFEVPDPIGFADGGPGGSTWTGGPWAAEGRMARMVEVPRRGGGVRALAHLDPLVHSGYRALVSRVAPCVERAMGPWAQAGRCLHPRPARGLRLEPWRLARQRYLRLVHDMARPEEPLLHADVRDCYGSIRPGAVAETLRAMGAAAGDVRRIEGLLERLDADGVRGLPVGPEPSAVLANAVLASIDRILAREGLSHVRWVDDVVILPGADPAGALEAFRAGAAAMGLRPAEEKCRQVAADPERHRVPSGPRLLRPARTPQAPGSFEARGSVELERAATAGDEPDPFVARGLVAALASVAAGRTAAARRLLRHIRGRHRELAPLAAWGLSR